MKGKMLPYSIAVGIWNLLFTIIIVFIEAIILSISISWELLWKSYMCGYIFLWIANLRAIDEIK